jgi:putative transcriptional regulator
MASTVTSLRGQLLLDGGKLRGSFFNRTVVLICQPDEDGAVGLVLNRSTDKNVGEAIVADIPTALGEQPLFLGGPVQPGALSYLHTDSLLLNANVISNLSFGHSLDSLVEIGDSYSATNKVRIFAGYSGWSPGQLEEEMKREAWLTHPATVDLVFNTEPGTLWKAILQQKGWQYRLLAEAPDDPSLN